MEVNWSQTELWNQQLYKIKHFVHCLKPSYLCHTVLSHFVLEEETVNFSILSVAGCICPSNNISEKKMPVHFVCILSANHGLETTLYLESKPNIYIVQYSL